MKAILQRVNHASVTVEGKVVGQIDRGLLIFLGIAPEDSEQDAQQFAARIANLRIFEDENEKMNLSLLDISGAALVVSQFTLFADTSHGRRPSFIGAAAPQIAKPLCDYFATCLAALGVATAQGIFGAHMLVALENDGPVTISMEQPVKKQSPSQNAN